VLAGVVGTEEKLQARGKFHPEVGLGTATVATVGRAKGGGTRGNCSSHIGLISHLGVSGQRATRSFDSPDARWFRTHHPTTVKEYPPELVLTPWTPLAMETVGTCKCDAQTGYEVALRSI
jgi:hypothetical protein